MTIATRPPRHSFRFRGRNFLALVLKPETPRAAWLADLDQWLARSPGFFTGKPLILDLAGLCFAQSDVVSLMAELDSRAIRIIGIEGADASILDKSLPPLLTGGRTAGSVEAIDAISSRPATPEPSYKDASPAPALAPAPVASLMIETPVRSGQTIMNPDGDVIILGSVASGAEVIASGSIHVYGALRGRALAGAYGNESARVFCRRFEAELVSIDGFYMTADDMDPALRGRAVTIRLDGDAIVISPLG